MTSNEASTNMNAEEFKEFVLELEKNNLKNVEREDKKIVVSKIIKTYEEMIKNGNQ